MSTLPLNLKVGGLADGRTVVSVTAAAAVVVVVVEVEVAVPTELRGRLAGIEMISYLSGPMLGNTQLGFLAGHLGVRRAITLSSLIGLCAVCGCTFALPKFRRYVADERPRTIASS